MFPFVALPYCSSPLLPHSVTSTTVLLLERVLGDLDRRTCGWSVGGHTTRRTIAGQIPVWRTCAAARGLDRGQLASAGARWQPFQLLLVLYRRTGLRRG